MAHVSRSSAVHTPIMPRHTLLVWPLDMFFPTDSPVNDHEHGADARDDRLAQR